MATYFRLDSCSNCHGCVAKRDGISSGARKNTLSFSRPLDLWIVINRIPSRSSVKIPSIISRSSATVSASTTNAHNTSIFSKSSSIFGDASGFFQPLARSFWASLSASFQSSFSNSSIVRAPVLSTKSTKLRPMSLPRTRDLILFFNNHS